MKPHHLVAVTVLLAACARDVTTPGNSSAPNPATAVALGAQFSCALTKAGKAYCWGDALSGELGDSSFVSKLVPAATAGGHTFVAIAAGVETACALTQSGAAWCWGSDPTQAGAKLYSNTPKAVPGAPSLASITVGNKFACGLDRDGVAYCWGENEHGQLGVGDSVAHPSATRVSGSHRFLSISAGFWHACALATDGVPYCWGDNSFAQLGTTDTHSAAVPTAVPGVNFTSMISGSIHVCGLTSAGAAMCWGSNDSGQLGDGTITQRRTAVAVLGGLTFKSLYTGRANSIFATTCGITPSDDVYCWGWNSKGQLGAQTSDTCKPYTVGGVSVTNVCSMRPVKANGVSNVVSLAVGNEHVCALTASHQLLCWGENAHGELGDGTGVAQTTPVEVHGGLSLP